MKYMFALAILLFAALPAGAETIEELKAQLEAQKQINELQRQRIETLEAELAGRDIFARFVRVDHPFHHAAICFLGFITQGDVLIAGLPDPGHFALDELDPHGFGILEKLFEIYWGQPLLGGNTETWFAFVLALIVLLFRPQGLFGERIIERV